MEQSKNGKNCISRAALLVMLCALIFCACSNEADDDTSYASFGSFADQGLSAETERQIRTDYMDKLIEEGYTNHSIADVWIINYYGTYNGNVAVMLYAKDLTYSSESEIFGTFSHPSIIRYPNGNRIVLWKDGEFFQLGEGLIIWADSPASNLISLSDLVRLANEYNGLSAQTELLVKEDYISWRCSIEPNWDPYRPNGQDYYYYSCLGTYNNYIAMQIYAFNVGSIPEPIEEIIGGITFSLRPPDRIFLWKEGQIYDLATLYNSSLITKEDLISIRNNSRG